MRCPAATSSRRAVWPPWDRDNAYRHAVVMGYLSGLAGPRRAVLWPAAAMLLVVGFLLARTRLWRQEAV